MEPKLRIIRKKKSEAENAHLDPLMRALKALHSAGAPESMTAEELERQRRRQRGLGLRRGGGSRNRLGVQSC